MLKVQGTTCYTKKETMQILNIGRWSFDRLVREGALHLLRVGRWKYVSEDELAYFLKKGGRK